MTRRVRLRAPIAVNYWPGYVDALTNVVLNLLFLIAMFGIALTVVNTGGGVRTKDRSHAAKGSGGTAADGTAGTAALAAGTVGQSGSGPDLAGAARLAVARDGLGEPGIGTGRLPGTGSRRASASGGAAQTPSAGMGRRSVPIGRTGPRRPGNPGDRGGNFADPGPEAAPALRRSGSGQLGGGYATAGMPGGPLNFSVVDAYQRRFVPGVRILRQPVGKGQTLLTISVPAGVEPVASLQQTAVGSALGSALGLDPAAARPAGRVRLWTATQLVDPARRRIAYLALIEARNRLLAIGYPPSAIEVRLIEGSAGTRDAMLIYLLGIPDNQD